MNWLFDVDSARRDVNIILKKFRVSSARRQFLDLAGIYPLGEDLDVVRLLVREENALKLFDI